MGVRGCCTLIDRQHARQIESKIRDLFTSYRRQVVTLVVLAPRLLRCIFFPRKLLGSFLDGRSSLSVASSHNQVQHCRRPGGFKSACFLIGPLRGGWVQLSDTIPMPFFFCGVFFLGFAFELD